MKPVEKRKATGKLAELIEEFNNLPCEEKIHRISDTRVKMEKEVWIEKACKWLKENAYFYVNDYTGSLNDNMLVDEFRKAMKGE